MHSDTHAVAPCLLSICVPTRDRPQLLLRALDSVLSQDRAELEIVVSDNSEGDESAELCRRVLDLPSGRHRYSLNRPELGLVGNVNRCVELARGEWVLILHDDDYLLPGAVRAIIRAAGSVECERMALLFGVRVVDGSGRVLKRQTFRAERYLPPRDAMRRLMSNSSFVRPPAIVVRRRAYALSGQYAEDMEGTNDIEMWSRLFSAFGVTCMKDVVAAYTVHLGALTTHVFEPGTLARIDEIFGRVADDGLVAEAELRRWHCAFVHQFILGGTYRHMRRKDLAGARKVLSLFDLPAVRGLGISFRWVPVRTAFAVLTWGRAPRGTSGSS